MPDPIRWLRYDDDGTPRHATLVGDQVQPVVGSPFDGSAETLAPAGPPRPLAGLTLLTPCVPRTTIALWNNFQAAADKNGWARPEEPLWLVKTPNTQLAPGAVIPQPRHYDGRVVYEGELGVVIGRRACDVSEDEAAACIFGYTCVNDVTALELITRDSSFAQWCRAKSLDGFGPFGPVIATGLDWTTLEIRTRLNGRERQRYPAADMIFSPAQLVSRLSRELTLEPGDLIACGTSLGVMPMKPGQQVEVEIEGIGILSNTYGAAAAAAGA